MVVIYDFCLSFFFHQSIPSVSDIYSMLHTSRPDNASSALLQLHTAPNCQYKVLYFIPSCCFLKGELISYRQHILYFVFIGVYSDFVSKSAWAGVLALWYLIWHAVTFQPQNIPQIQKELFFFRFCVSVVQFCPFTQL